MLANTDTDNTLKKTVVFLHGFLGNPDDWDEVIHSMPRELTYLTLDLTRHLSLESMLKVLDELEVPICDLVGYSMGGRIAIQLKHLYPARFNKVIALSAHPGLTTLEEKRKRWESDLEWIRILKTKPFPEFLTLWYKQPLFKTFYNNKALFNKTLERRKKQDPDILANLLKVFSLARQDLMIPEGTHFLCGSEDLKYLEIYQSLLSTNHYEIIKGSGHVIHLEAPQTCGEILWKWLNGKNAETTLTLGITNGKE